MKFNYINRIRFLTFCVLAFSLLLISRLYFLQVVHGDTYSNRADRQYSSTAQKIFDRGSIFFTNKDGSLVSAATLKSGFIIAVNTEILKNPEEVWQKINEIMPIEKEEFMAKATKPKDRYEEVAIHVDVYITYSGIII
jgi:cell division protein FtsI/penicillin-binding protein 2